MAIRIVTDSTADLPIKEVKKLGISVIPCYINFGSHSFLDGVDISRREFYEKLPSFPVQPTTSAPGIEVFITAYKKLIQSGAEGILSIHISRNLSNVANVASLAAEAMNNELIKVIDPGQLTLGTGLLVHAAAKMAAQGVGLAEIIRMLNDKASRTYTFAILNTLEFLRRSGRVSRLAAGLGSILDIKPMLKMHSGEMALEKIRTRNGAIKRLIKLVEGLGPLEQIALVHTYALEKAQELKKWPVIYFHLQVRSGRKK